MRDRAHRQFVGWLLKTIHVFQNEAKISHELRPFKASEFANIFGHKQRVVPTSSAQGLNLFHTQRKTRVNRMARPTRAPIALKRLCEKCPLPSLDISPDKQTAIE